MERAKGETGYWRICCAQRVLAYAPGTAGEVRKWEYDFSTGQCTTADHYAPGELLVTETTNAEGASGAGSIRTRWVKPVLDEE